MVGTGVGGIVGAGEGVVFAVGELVAAECTGGEPQAASAEALNINDSVAALRPRGRRRLN
ncbi:MAG: hypothetical protein ACRENL_02655 [Candidatus Dormibacteria bacterium]